MHAGESAVEKLIAFTITLYMGNKATLIYQIKYHNPIHDVHLGLWLEHFCENINFLHRVTQKLVT